MESKENFIAIVKSPSKDAHLRDGKGFSLNEIKQAGITVKLLKELNIKVDYFRKSVHTENIEKLKKIEVLKKKGKRREPFVKKERKRTPFKPEKEKAKIKQKKVIEKVHKKPPIKAEPKKPKIIKKKEEIIEEKGIPLTELTGLGTTIAKKFFDLGVNNIEELCNENPEELAPLVSGVSLKRLKKWIEEGKQLIK